MAKNNNYLRRQNGEENLEVALRLFAIPAIIKWIRNIGSNDFKISNKAGNDADDNKLNQTNFNQVTLCHAGCNHRG